MNNATLIVKLTGKRRMELKPLGNELYLFLDGAVEAEEEYVNAVNRLLDIAAEEEHPEMYPEDYMAHDLAYTGSVL